MSAEYALVVERHQAFFEVAYDEHAAALFEQRVARYFRQHTVVLSAKDRGLSMSSPIDNSSSARVNAGNHPFDGGIAHEIRPTCIGIMARRLLVTPNLFAQS